MPGIASAATAVGLAYVGTQTSTIRIGAGGIMLPNHAPLTIAEQFGTLESLFPGRVDLGLGRAPGTDQAAAFALRRNLNADENQFPNDVLELQGYFKGASGRVRAIPGEGLDIPLWILGSSLFGAQLAAMLGLPYAFASHFAPQMLDDAIRVYRETFRPSEQLDKPYVMLGFNAFVADSDEEAELLSTSIQQAFVALRTGQPTKLPAAAGRLCRDPATRSPGRSCGASCPVRRSEPGHGAQTGRSVRRPLQAGRADGHGPDPRPSGTTEVIPAADGSDSTTGGLGRLGPVRLRTPSPAWAHA